MASAKLTFLKLAQPGKYVRSERSATRVIFCVLGKEEEECVESEEGRAGLAQKYSV